MIGANAEIVVASAACLVCRNAVSARTQPRPRLSALGYRDIPRPDPEPAVSVAIAALTSKSARVWAGVEVPRIRSVSDAWAV